MSQLLNQYSTLWITAAFALFTMLIIFRQKPKVSDYVAIGVVLTGLLVAWSILHPTQTPLMDNAKIVQHMIGKGTPVLLEFQSPY